MKRLNWISLIMVQTLWSPRLGGKNAQWNALLNMFSYILAQWTWLTDISVYSLLTTIQILKDVHSSGLNWIWKIQVLLRGYSQKRILLVQSKSTCFGNMPKTCWNVLVVIVPIKYVLKNIQLSPRVAEFFHTSCFQLMHFWLKAKLCFFLLNWIWATD